MNDKKRINRKVKWIATLLAIVTFFVVGSGKHSTPLSNRAMVVGLGIDLTPSGYEVSTQILSSAQSESSTNNSRVVSAFDKTLSGALIQISEEISKVVSLSHCNTVLLGRSLIDDDAYKVLNFLIRNSYLSENALLLTSETTAKDILSTPVAFNSTAPFYTQQIIGVYGNFSNISKITVKDFIVNFYCDKSTNCIPVIRKVVAEKPIIPQGSSGDENKTDYLFDLTQTAVVVGRNLRYVENGQGTTNINYVMSKIGKGTLTYESEDGSYIEFHVIEKKQKKKFDAKNSSCKIELEFLLVLKEIIKEGGDTTPTEKIELSDSDKKRLEDELAQGVLTTFEKARENGADVFMLCESMAKRKRAETFPLEDINLEVKAKIKFK